MGLVVRNPKGEIEAVMVEYIAGCYDAVHVETLTILKALIFTRDFGLTHFVLEGDALNVIMKIKEEQIDPSMTGHIIQGIQNLMKQFQAVRIMLARGTRQHMKQLKLLLFVIAVMYGLRVFQYLSSMLYNLSHLNEI